MPALRLQLSFTCVTLCSTFIQHDVSQVVFVSVSYVIKGVTATEK